MKYACCVKPMIGWALCCGILAIFGCETNSTNMSTSNNPQTKSIQVESRVEKEDVKLIVSASPASPSLSEIVELNIRVEYVPGLEIEPITFGGSVGDFAVKSFHQNRQTGASNESDSQPNQGLVVTYQYKLEPLLSGRHLIRSIPVAITDNRKSPPTRMIIQSEPLELTITSVVDENKIALENVVPMHEPIDPRAPTAIWIMGGVVGSALGLLLLLWFVLHRRSAIEVVLSPKESAQRELEILLAESLPQRGQVKEFYLRLTNIVRVYLEQTTGVRAPELTTEEFLVDMNRSGRFGIQTEQGLKEFLEAADMVKYAGMRPASQGINEALGRAREFIQMEFQSSHDEKSVAGEENR